MESYTGVSIKVGRVCFPLQDLVTNMLAFSKVSFNSKVDEGLRIQQLSGGQKALVALATGEFRRRPLKRRLLMDGFSLR